MNERSGDLVEALFDRAVNLSPAERATFLDEACRDDPALRAEVEGLLACDEPNSPHGLLLDNSPVQRAAAISGARSDPAFGPPAARGEAGTLGPYRVAKPLGEGGMGVVYTAIDTRLDRRVALKVMLPQFAADPAARQRFLREARAAAQVSHDNVITVYEADERDGIPYIAMQLLGGRSLDESLRADGIPPIPEVLRIARQAAEGLAAAHAIGLVHRDVKPSNLWLESPHGRVKVLDFGLAKPMDNRVGVTMSGAVVGTPAYMSPEQARGDAVSASTDLFSLGAVLYRLCGGRMPFEGPSTMAVLMALGMEEPKPLRELNPAIPAPLAELIHQMLAKRPEARPRSAAEVAQRAHAIAEGRSIPTTQSTPTRVPRGSNGSRRRFPTAAVVAALLAILAYGANLVRNRNRVQTKVGIPSGTTPTSGAPNNANIWEQAVARMAAPEQVRAVRERLKDLNPKFDERSLSNTIEKGVVVELAIADASALNDLTPLHALTGLKGLQLSGNFIGAADISPLRGMKLESFDSNGCPHKDLSPLAGMPLRKANFWGLVTTDLSPLRGMKLTETNVGNSRVKDISVLKGMPLEVVCLNVSDVEDLSPLAGAPLRTLFAANTKATDLRPVANAPIEWLCINGSPIEDFTPLKTMRLKKLEIDEPQRHAKLLRSIATLKTINFRPAAEVLGDAVESMDSDRAAARWALSIGGKLRVNDDRECVAEADIPREPFTVVAVDLRGNQAVTDAAVGYLGALQRLKRLDLEDTPVTNAGLSRIAECLTLESLRLSKTHITGDGLAHLEKLQALTHLYVGGTPLGDVHLRHVAKLKALTHLFMQFSQVTDDGLIQLRELKGLRHLDLFGTPVTDDGMARLREFPSLTEVGLGSTRVGDVGLADIANLPGLTNLTLDYTPVTDAGLLSLKKCRGMRILDLGATGVGDVGLAVVREFNELTELTLQGTRITDGGLANLQESRKLALIRLTDTAVTDAGLTHLEGLKALKLLEIRKTRVTAAGVKRFQAAVPQCHVDHEALAPQPAEGNTPR